jgi:hypothetical protein
MLAVDIFPPSDGTCACAFERGKRRALLDKIIAGF